MIEDFTEVAERKLAYLKKLKNELPKTEEERGTREGQFAVKRYQNALEQAYSAIPDRYVVLTQAYEAERKAKAEALVTECVEFKKRLEELKK